MPRGVWLTPGAVHVCEGRIAAVAAPDLLHARAPRATRIELSGAALVPGLVNAHAHLELTGLAGTLPAGRDFQGWVRGVVRKRSEQTADDLERAAILGARACLDSGATTVGDFDATGAAQRALTRSPAQFLPRVVLLRELLDAGDPARTERELLRLQDVPEAKPQFRAGLAPHAPHTVSEKLLRNIALSSRARGLVVATHWAETEEEGAWLESGSGPFAKLLGRSPHRSGLDLLDDAGLLKRNLTLVHANHARPEEIARVARCGASVVHCPGTHAFFERAPFDLRAWYAAGVPVALGTDSLASNTALDMRLELSRLCAAQPWLDPRDAFDAATIHGARALGLEGQVGEIAPGAFADLLAVRATETDDRSCFERLAHGDFELLHVFVAGIAVDGERASPARNVSAGCAPGRGNPG